MARLKLANVVEVRGALDVLLQGYGLRGGSAAVFEQLLAASPLGASALQCCNQNAKVLADNGGRPHTKETLANEMARIKRRLNKDAHPNITAAQYRIKGERLLLARDGLSESDVEMLSCVLHSHGYQVEIVDEAQLTAS